MGTQVTTTTHTHNAWNHTEHIYYISVVTHLPGKSNTVSEYFKKNQQTHSHLLSHPADHRIKHFKKKSLGRGFVKLKYISLLDSGDNFSVFSWFTK